MNLTAQKINPRLDAEWDKNFNLREQLTTTKGKARKALQKQINESSKRAQQLDALCNQWVGATKMPVYNR